MLIISKKLIFLCCLCLFFSAFLGVLALIILIGTLIDIWDQANPYRELLPNKSTRAPQSMLIKVLKCFSFVENGKRILNTDPPKDGSNHLGCLSGIRYPLIRPTLEWHLTI